MLMQDYLDLTGSYDKLVSIEMIEAVGWRDFGTFFAKCSDLLGADGAMLLQAIAIDDRAYRSRRPAESSSTRRSSPAGACPSLEVIARSVARRTDLQIVDLEDITPHYVRRSGAGARTSSPTPRELDGLGYDERFRRLWTMYLAYCEAGFAERRICDVQLKLAKPGWREPGAGAVLVPATRASIGA